MAEAFLARLPEGKLSAAEEELRDLLRRTAEATAAFLPRTVPLGRWVEQRIPGEVVLRTDNDGFTVLAPLRRKPVEIEKAPWAVAAANDAPKVDVESWFDRLPPDALTKNEQQLREVVLGIIADARAPVPLPLVWRHEKVRSAKNFLPRGVTLEEWVERRIGAEVTVSANSTGEATLALPKEDRRAALDAFFESLPSDSFTPAEERLRRVLLKFIDNHRGQAMNISNAGSDPTVQAAKAGLLGDGRKGGFMKEWIERRIGGEIELSEAKNGQWIMSLTPAGRAALPRRPADAGPEARGGARGGAIGLSSVSDGRGRGRGQGRGLDAGEGRAGGGRAKERGLEAREVPDEEKVKIREAFFAALPADELSPAEEDMRAALIEFLTSWTGEALPTLSEAGADEKVRAVRQILLPPGCHVSMKLWIDQRIGGEINTIMQEGVTNGGQIFIGMRDAIDPTMLEKAMEKAAAYAARRQTDGSEPAAKRSRRQAGPPGGR